MKGSRSASAEAAQPEGAERPAWVAALRRQVHRHLRLTGQAAWRALGEMYDNEDLTHAASIAYYALLSLFPFLLLLLSVLGSLTSAEEDRDAVIRYVFRYFPRQFDFIARQVD